MLWIISNNTIIQHKYRNDWLSRAEKISWYLNMTWKILLYPQAQIYQHNITVYVLSLIHIYKYAKKVITTEIIPNKMTCLVAKLSQELHSMSLSQFHWLMCLFISGNIILLFYFLKCLQLYRDIKKQIVTHVIVTN